MTVGPEGTKPVFSVDDPTLLRATLLREGIYERPDDYLEALESIDGEFVGPLTESADNAKSQLTEFFDKRDDLSITYDDDTEMAIDNDIALQGMIGELHKMRPSTRTSRGARGNQQIEKNPADDLRDRIRRRSLANYIIRVLEWQDLQAAVTEESTVRAAG